MHPLHPTLSTLGLSEKETVMYLTLLQVGISPSSSLGRRTKLSRSTAQYTCDQLVQKGIARCIPQGKARLFAAEPPESLLQIIAKQREELAEKEKTIRSVLAPLQEMMRAPATSSRVQVYEGEEGVEELRGRIAPRMDDGIRVDGDTVIIIAKDGHPLGVVIEHAGVARMFEGIINK
jgi:sugar-specific transcriptional regulator TrmB